MTEIDNADQDQTVHANLPSTTVAASGEFEYLKAINDAWQNHLVAWYNSREVLDEPIYKYLDPKNTKLIPMGVLKDFILDVFDITEDRVDRLLHDAVTVGDYRAVLVSVSDNVRSLKASGKWILYNELLGKGVIKLSAKEKEPGHRKKASQEFNYLSTLLTKRNKERPKGAPKSGFIRKAELVGRAHRYITKMLPATLKLTAWLKEHGFDSYVRKLLEKEYSKIIDANLMDLLFGKLKEGKDFSSAGTTAEEIGRIFSILSQWRGLGLTAHAKERQEFRTGANVDVARRELLAAFSTITLMVSTWRAKPVKFLASEDTKQREYKLEGVLEPLYTILRKVRDIDWPEEFVINHDRMLTAMVYRFRVSNISEPFLIKWAGAIRSLLVHDNMDFAQDVASAEKLDDISLSIPGPGHDKDAPDTEISDVGSAVVDAAAKQEEPTGAASKEIEARIVYGDQLKQEVIEFFRKPNNDRFKRGVEKKAGGDLYKWQGNQWVNRRTGRLAPKEISGKFLADELKRWGLPLVREYLTVLGGPDPSLASLVGELGLNSEDMGFWIDIFNSENGGILESHIFAVFMALMEIKRYGRRKLI